jgi:hypothetical protein
MDVKCDFAAHKAVRVYGTIETKQLPLDCIHFVHQTETHVFEFHEFLDEKVY